MLQFAALSEEGDQVSKDIHAAAGAQQAGVQRQESLGKLDIVKRTAQRQHANSMRQLAGRVPGGSVMLHLAIAIADLDQALHTVVHSLLENASWQPRTNLGLHAQFLPDSSNKTHKLIWQRPVGFRKPQLSATAFSQDALPPFSDDDVNLASSDVHSEFFPFEEQPLKVHKKLYVVRMHHQANTLVDSVDMLRAELSPTKKSMTPNRQKKGNFQSIFSRRQRVVKVSPTQMMPATKYTTVPVKLILRPPVPAALSLQATELGQLVLQSPQRTVLVLVVWQLAQLTLMMVLLIPINGLKLKRQLTQQASTHITVAMLKLARWWTSSTQLRNRLRSIQKPSMQQNSTSQQLMSSMIPTLQPINSMFSCDRNWWQSGLHDQFSRITRQTRSVSIRGKAQKKIMLPVTLVPPFMVLSIWQRQGRASQYTATMAAYPKKGSRPFRNSTCQAGFGSWLICNSKPNTTVRPSAAATKTQSAQLCIIIQVIIASRARSPSTEMLAPISLRHQTSLPVTSRMQKLLASFHMSHPKPTVLTMDVTSTVGAVVLRVAAAVAPAPTLLLATAKLFPQQQLSVVVDMVLRKQMPTQKPTASSIDPAMAKQQAQCTFELGSFSVVSSSLAGCSRLGVLSGWVSSCWSRFIAQLEFIMF